MELFPYIFFGVAIIVLFVIVLFLSLKLENLKREHWELHNTVALLSQEVEETRAIFQKHDCEHEFIYDMELSPVYPYGGYPQAVEQTPSYYRKCELCEEKEYLDETEWKRGNLSNLYKKIADLHDKAKVMEDELS